MTGNASSQQEQVMMQQKSSMTSHMQGQIAQQSQMHQQQLNMPGMQAHVQPRNFEMQPHMQPSVVNKHMFGDMQASDESMLVPQQQQHPHFVGPMQQIPMQIDQPANQCVPMQQQQKFGITQTLSSNISMQSPGTEVLLDILDL